MQHIDRTENLDRAGNTKRVFHIPRSKGNYFRFSTKNSGNAVNTQQ